MSLPALRQPKWKLKKQVPEKAVDSSSSSPQFMFITLKDEKRLVVSSDAYHGILRLEGMYKCVFCAIDLKLDLKQKDFHTNSIKHKDRMEATPFIEEMSENLLRKLNKEQIYCTICNVIVSTPFFERHISSEVHQDLLGRAMARASSYSTS